jgi:hypothetical protein
MKDQPKLKPRVPMQAAPVARQGEVKNEKGVGPSIYGRRVLFAAAFAADDAE